MDVSVEELYSAVLQELSDVQQENRALKIMNKKLTEAQQNEAPNNDEN
ncbi:hypothetical protein [Weissella minor]|nr:hypothetical protein [Weissella minor]